MNTLMSSVSAPTLFGVKLPLAVLLIITLAGCASDAHYPLNKPHVAPSFMTTASQTANNTHKSSDSLLVILAFSGGGTRAAALSYGVLETLATQEIIWEGQSRRMLDEIDVISSVSGGSFTAAYFGLRGARTFNEFETAFLKRDVEAELKDQMLTTGNLSRLTSPNFGRSDVLAEHYDRLLFHGATLGDLQRNGGPRIIINATRMTRGTPFAFTPHQFEAIGSNPDSFTVARAVAASSAVPVLFSPIVLRDFRDTSCLSLPPLSTDKPETRAEPTTGCYIQLLDGGLHDNLGLGVLLARAGEHDDPMQVLREAGFPNTRKVVVIQADATAPLDRRWERTARIPPPEAVLEAASGIPLLNTNRETMNALKARADIWRTLGLDVSIIEVNLDNLPDPAQRTRLQMLPTALTLPPTDVDALRRAARDLLLANPEFQRLTSTN